MKGWGDFAALFLKLLAFLGIYRAGKKSAEAAQDRDTLNKVEKINDARADNALRSDGQLRERLLDDINDRRKLRQRFLPDD